MKSTGTWLIACCSRNSCDPADRPGVAGVVDRAAHAGAHRIVDLRVGEVRAALTNLLRACGERSATTSSSRETPRSQAAPSAADSATWSRIASRPLGERHSRVLAGVGDLGRLVAAAAGREVDADQPQRGDHGRAEHRDARHERRAAHSSSLPRASAAGTSASNARPAATQNEVLKACVAARAIWPSVALCKLLCSASSPASAGVVAERRRDHRHAAVGVADAIADRGAESDLVLRRQARVEQQRRAGELRVLRVLFQVGGEDRRQQHQPEHDAGVTRGDRPAAVDRLRRAPAQRRRRQRLHGQAEPGADQDLRSDRPDDLGAGQQRQRRQPAGDRDRRRPRRACACRSRAGARAGRRRAPTAASP